MTTITYNYVYVCAQDVIGELFWWLT